MKHRRLVHPRRLAVLVAASFVALLVVFGLATAASAATFEQKLAVLGSFTQTDSTSYSSWYSARQNQGAWVDYGFDWSTDYCSSSPDQPLGFDFRMPCARHDFGYRNYKMLEQFPSNKDHVDSAFYADLKRKCATYSIWVRSACYSLAWTYYEAVHLFGNLAVPADAIDQAAALKADGEAAAADASADN
jgi:hypothetical protein